MGARNHLAEPAIEPLLRALVAINVVAVAIRILVSFPLSRSYDRTTWTFWLSWLADPLAVFRIVQSTVIRRRTWRGRRYDVEANGSGAERLPPH